MRTLLDTSVLLGPSPEPLEGELAISTISLAELHFGVLTASSDGDRAERLRRACGPPRCRRAGLRGSAAGHVLAGRPPMMPAPPH